MTRGATPKFSDDLRAQWIKRELEKRDWAKKDLAAALTSASGGRLKLGGALQLVHRATSGHDISPPNRALLSEVLGGPDPLEIGQRIEELVEAGVRVVSELSELLREAAALRGVGSMPPHGSPGHQDQDPPQSATLPFQGISS